MAGIGKIQDTQAAPRWYPGKCAYEYPPVKLVPEQYLRKGKGSLGFVNGGTRGSLQQPVPPSAGALLCRKKDICWAFRLSYDRGDLPIVVSSRSSRRPLLWKVDISRLDLHHYLPLFFDGLREKEEPYGFVAVQAIGDILRAHGSAVLPVIPQLIMPMKRALETRDLEVVCTIMMVLRNLALRSDVIGQALVPFFRQILPIVSLFQSCEKRVRSRVADSRDSRRCVADLVAELLQTLEFTGGPDAFKQIKLMVPTYESIRYVA